MSEIKVNSQFRTKQGDTAPWPTQTITENGKPVSLAGATVRVILREIGATTPKFKKLMAVQDAASAKVRFEPVAEDVDTAGKYLQEIEVTWASGAATFPNDGYNLVVIHDDLDG